MKAALTSLTALVDMLEMLVTSATSPSALAPVVKKKLDWRAQKNIALHLWEMEGEEGGDYDKKCSINNSTGKFGYHEEGVEEEDEVGGGRGGGGSTRRDGRYGGKRNRSGRQRQDSRTLSSRYEPITRYSVAASFPLHEWRHSSLHRRRSVPEGTNVERGRPRSATVTSAEAGMDDGEGQGQRVEKYKEGEGSVAVTSEGDRLAEFHQRASWTFHHNQGAFERKIDYAKMPSLSLLAEHDVSYTNKHFRDFPRSNQWRSLDGDTQEEDGGNYYGIGDVNSS